MNFQLEADEREKVPFRVHAVAFVRLRQPWERFQSEALIGVQRGLARGLPCHVEGFEEFPILLATLDRACKAVELLSIRNSRFSRDSI